MNYPNCKRCGRTLVIGPKATNKKFCSSTCYRDWWREQNFAHATQAIRVRKQLGESPNFEHLTDLEATWLACAIDGEGSIGIHRQLSNDRWGYKYRPVVCVNNTNKDFLDKTQKMVGESWYFLKNNPNTKLVLPNHKPGWTVQIKPRAIPGILEQIKSYLVIKNKQADLVLEFCRAVAASPVHNRAMQPEFERLYRACKALNKRGTK